MPEQPLTGLRILDLTTGMAGPFCTKLLGAVGAEVLKIEPPPRGDPTRHHPPFFNDSPDAESSGLFAWLNTNKKSVTLNLESPLGRRLLGRLLATVDALVEDLPGDTWEQWGLFPERLRQQYPYLVWSSLTPFGLTGAYTTLPWEETVLEALGGLMFLTGEPRREPLKLPGYLGALLAGLWGAIPTMAALLQAQKTGLGQRVEVSALEGIAAILDGALTAFAYDGSVRGRTGHRHRTPYPAAILPCADGHVYIHALDQEQLALLVQEPSLAEAPLAGRYHQEAEAVEKLLRPWLQQRTRRGIVEAAQELRLPFAMVLKVSELFHDPQLKARSFFDAELHPALGPITLPGPPFRSYALSLSQGDALPWHSSPPPLLGEHNEEILCGWLGYLRPELVLLRANGVI